MKFLINKLRLVQDKSIVSLLLLAATAFYCTYPLFVHRSLPLGADIGTHIYQADRFNRSIIDGALYPRWLPDAGYGSATFIFYSPLSYYLVSAIYHFIPSLILSMSIAIWFSFFFSGISMLLAAKKIFGRSGSLLAAIAYQILPFHLLDLYMRGTFPGLFAYMWFPLIILFMHDALESGSGWAFIGVSVSYAGLILTQLASAFIFSIAMGAYLIYNFFLIDKKTVLKTSLSPVLGLGLSSFYLIPVIFERKFVHIDYMASCAYCDYKKTFLFKWGKIQSLSSFFYLQLHIAVVLEVMLFLIVVLLLRKNWQRLPDKPEHSFSILLFLFAFFLVTPLSAPVWAMTPGFPTLQFPWRWIPMMELSLCLLIPGIFAEGEKLSLKSTDSKKRSAIYLMITILCMSLIIISLRPMIPARFSSKIVDPEQLKQIIDKPVEYTPVWANNIDEIKTKKISEGVSNVTGTALTNIEEWKSEKKVVNVIAFTPSLLRVSTFYYPGWKAEVDGRQAFIAAENRSGAMLIEVPAGKHTLELRFVDTPLRYYAKLSSLISCLLILFLVCFQGMRHQTYT